MYFREQWIEAIQSVAEGLQMLDESEANLDEEEMDTSSGKLKKKNKVVHTMS